MPIFAVSKKFLPLVNVGRIASHRQQITISEILSLYNHNQPLIFFNKFTEAKTMMLAMLPNHAVKPENITHGISIVASPIIFTFNSLKQENHDLKKLTPDVISEYADPSAIPYFDKQKTHISIPDPRFSAAMELADNHATPMYWLQTISTKPNLATFCNTEARVVSVTFEKHIKSYLLT